MKDPLSESIFRARVPANVSVCSYTTFIQVSDIASACKNQKSGKATGCDDMAMEALTNGTYGLFVHLAILFYLFINFSYLPNSFLQSIIVLLVKNKAGDLSDLNNYRAIALSPVVSKLFEGVLARFLGSYSTVDNHQFGFKAGHSASLCTNVLKQTVDYYSSRGSYVFACFVDIQK